MPFFGGRVGRRHEVIAKGPGERPLKARLDRQRFEQRWPRAGLVVRHEVAEGAEAGLRRGHLGRDFLPPVACRGLGARGLVEHTLGVASAALASGPGFARGRDGVIGRVLRRLPAHVLGQAFAFPRQVVAASAQFIDPRARLAMPALNRLAPRLQRLLVN